LKGNRGALALLVLFVFGLSLYANLSFLVTRPGALRFFPPFRAGVDVNFNLHLGAEYLSIARALANGKGFSNPFQIDTGPTAWMPPVYPFLLAGLLRLLGQLPLVAAAVVLSKNLALVATGMLVLAAARASAVQAAPAVALAGYAAWLLCHFSWFFQMTHDEWLILLCVDASLLGAWRIALHGIRGRQALAWGGLGGLVFLTSPVAGASWLATTAWLARKRSLRRPLFAAGLLALALAGLWGLRNQAVLGRPYFVKSNLFFDLYQANFASPDGVYDEPFLAQHPVWTTLRDPDSPYRSLGEVAFLDAYRARFLADARAHPEALAGGALRRLLAATLVYKPYRPYYEGLHPPLTSFVHALPFLGLVLLLVLCGRRLEPIQRIAVLFYAVYLAPYALSAFYLRYLLPLTPVLVLLWFWGVDALIARGLARAPAGEPRAAPR
jgi:hypothetical protein